MKLRLPAVLHSVSAGQAPRFMRPFRQSGRMWRHVSDAAAGRITLSPGIRYRTSNPGQLFITKRPGVHRAIRFRQSYPEGRCGCAAAAGAAQTAARAGIHRAYGIQMYTGRLRALHTVTAGEADMAATAGHSRFRPVYALPVPYSAFLLRTAAPEALAGAEGQEAAVGMRRAGRPTEAEAGQAEQGTGFP